MEGSLCMGDELGRLRSVRAAPHQGDLAELCEASGAILA